MRGPTGAAHRPHAPRRLLPLAAGVWEFLTNEQAVQIVSACSNPDVAAKKLVDRAHARWIAEEAGVIDDISVVIVKWKKQP